MKITTRDSADMKIVDVEGKFDSNSSSLKNPVFREKW